MNYLQLGQQLTIECGSQSTQLTTMQSLTGEQLRFKGWIDQGWMDIQTIRPDWRFMRSNIESGGGVSFVPSAAQPHISWGTGAGTLGIAQSVFSGKWDKSSFRVYSTVAGFSSETPLEFLPEPSLDNWRNAYYFGAQKTVQTRPVVLAIAPDGSLFVGPPSDGSYTCYGDYYAAPTFMSLDTDTPTNLPNQFHMLIVYKGMIKYGQYESAPEVIERGTMLYEEMFRSLETDWGPVFGRGGTLA